MPAQKSRKEEIGGWKCDRETASTILVVHVHCNVTQLNSALVLYPHSIKESVELRWSSMRRKVAE
jgi:hypothetical protein